MLMRILAFLTIAAAIGFAACSSTTASNGDNNTVTDVGGDDLGLAFDTGNSGDSQGADASQQGTDAVTMTDSEALKDSEAPDVPDVQDVQQIKDVQPQDTGPLDTGPMDTGPADSGPTDTGTPPATDPTCPITSQWLLGDFIHTDLMEPGLACIACHTKKGPKFSIAGTVYDNLNKKVTCNGVSGVKVEITGADGQVLTLSTNLAGNFNSSNAVALPYHARIIDAGGKERKMLGSQSTGDCNSCHTEQGLNAAPGRILIP
jgi:hypothetical protein